MGRMKIACGWLVGAYQLASRWLVGGFGVALGCLSPGYQQALMWTSAAPLPTAGRSVTKILFRCSCRRGTVLQRYSKPDA